MQKKSQSVGRAYLVGKLGERGLSRRQAVGIVNFIFAEMTKALRRGGEVEFPFGKLKRVKRLNKEWLRVGDEPPQPYTVEWELDLSGGSLLKGKEIEARETGAVRGLESGK